MTRTIFYSWQSDLPNDTNRTFIEECLNEGLKKISQKFDIELNLDRDVKDESGTPDIIRSIFSKIDKCTIFVADISIINPETKFKKMPNPNVLLELGYAANLIGWNRIICIFNEDYGKVEDLPFDLRVRKPIIYNKKSLGNEGAKQFLVSEISKAINDISSQWLFDNEIQDYLKVQIDQEILKLLSKLIKISYGYEIKHSRPQMVSEFLNLDEKKLLEILKERELLGFQIFKKYQPIEENLNNILANPLITNSFDKKQISAIIKILKNIRSFDYIHNWRVIPDLYISSGKKDEKYEIVYGKHMNDSNPAGSYLLLGKINSNKGIVLDSGIIVDNEKAKELLTVYRFNNKYLEMYVDVIYDFIKYINNWLTLTDDEFIIDNKTFLIKIKDNNQRPKQVEEG